MESACFTGHRGIVGDIADSTERLYQMLEQDIISFGLTDFYCGGAVGWDTLAAQTILQLKQIYPQIKLHLVLPCSNSEQTARWTDAQRQEFYRILGLADEVEYTSEHYYNGCMKVRNARLVEYATERCYCFWNPKRTSTGTYQTIRMARQKGLIIINFFRSEPKG